MTTRLDGRTTATLIAAPVLLALLGPPIAAQEPRDLRIRPPIGVTLQLSSSFHENFFQTPHSQVEPTVRAGGARVRFSEDWLRSLGGEGYLDGRLTVYQGFEPTYGTGGGLRLERWAQRLDIGMDYDWWLPRLDVTEEAGRADVGLIRADYWLRMGKFLELSAAGRFRWEGFVETGPDRTDSGEEGSDSPLPHRDWWDHSFVEIGGGARTRIFGRVFSPEVGLAGGGPRGWDPAAAYEQRETHVRIRSIPHDRLYVSGRYRMRERDYPDATPDSRNFERQDRREQLTLLVEIEISPATSWLVYYAQEHGRSSRPARDFTTRTLSVGLTFRRD